MSQWRSPSLRFRCKPSSWSASTLCCWARPWNKCWVSLGSCSSGRSNTWLSRRLRVDRIALYPVIICTLIPLRPRWLRSPGRSHLLWSPSWFPSCPHSASCTWTPSPCHASSYKINGLMMARALLGSRMFSSACKMLRVFLGNILGRRLP